MAFSDLRRYIFAVLVLGVLGFGSKISERVGARIESRWLSRGAGILGLAFLIWVLDITKIVCSSGECDAGGTGCAGGMLLVPSHESETAEDQSRCYYRPQTGEFTALDLFTIILILVVVILVAGLFLATRNRW
jgi:hypothetical protein